MAVLHHAFRCPASPELDRDISKLLGAADSGNWQALSAMALAGHALLAEEVHTAFYLGPDGAAPSWLQPEFISPGLAATALLAARFAPIANLSASNDANHYLLETQLPLLGWSAQEIGFLVRGQPVEAMLQAYAGSPHPFEPGGFRHTGGWTSGRMAQMLKARLDPLVDGVPSQAGDAARAAWQQLDDNDALADAQAMLVEIGDADWLVMVITH